MNHSHNSAANPEIPISLSEAQELCTIFFSEEGESLHIVPTRGQHHFIADLQETVQKNIKQYL